MLCNFQCRGVLIWQGCTVLSVGVGGGCSDIFSLFYHFSFSFSLFLGDGPINTGILSQRVIKPKTTRTAIYTLQTICSHQIVCMIHTDYFNSYFMVSPDQPYFHICFMDYFVTWWLFGDLEMNKFLGSNSEYAPYKKV